MGRPGPANVADLGAALGDRAPTLRAALELDDFPRAVKAAMGLLPPSVGRYITRPRNP